MKRATLASLFLATVCTVTALPAQAAFRIPQVVLSSTDLQGFMNAIPQAINVNTQQADFQRWKTLGVNVQTGMTLKLEASAVSDDHEIGVYNCSDLPPTLPAMFPVFKASDNPGLGWYAFATFNSVAHTLTVQVFTDLSVPVGAPVVYNGVNTENFGYYIKNTNTNETFFTEDKRQADSPQALVFQGKDGFGQGWWLCFEDSAPGTGGAEGRDFDDAIVFLESIAPTPVTKATWAAVKQRFR